MGDDGDDFGQFETATVTPMCMSSSGHASTASDRDECGPGAAGYDTTSMVIYAHI